MKKQFQSKSVPRGTRTIWRYLGALFILFTFAIGNVWAASDITVKLYVHGGTISADDWSSKSSGTYFQKKVAKNTQFDIPAPTQEGYSFVNWTVNEDGTGDSYTTSHSGSGSNITLHAQWLELPYTPTHLIDNKLKVNAEWNSKLYTTDATNITGLVDWQVAPGKDRTSNVTDKQTGKSDRTPAIFTTSTKEDDNYMYLSFTIASGKRLKLSAVNIPVFGISNSKTTLVEIEDAYSTKISVNGTITKDADGNGFGSYDFANVPYLKGTVTVKMWAYGSADGYRMKTPIYLDGTISDAPTEYAVSFDKNNEGASGTMSALYYEAGAVVTLPACGFTAPTGMEFDAWTSTDVTITSNQFTMPAKAVTIKATWKSAADKYTVHYMDADGTTPLAADELVEVTQKPAGLAEDPTKPLYTFAAWQKDAADIALDAEFWATVVKDAEITLTARWTKAYAQSIDMEQFVMDNTKAGNWHAYLDSKGYAYASSNMSLDSLDGGKTKNNYQYLGLKFNKNSENTYVEGNLQAQKLMILKVGAVGNNTYMKIDGAKVAEPAIVGGVEADSAAAYTYWYYDTDKTFSLFHENGGTSMLKGITITDPFTVSFDANGGDDVASLNGTPSVTLPLPVKGTESFLGWFDGETNVGMNGDKYTPTANIILVAHWEAVSTDARLSAITFSSDAGTLSPAFNPEVTNYTYTMPYGTAAVPTITGATKANPAAKDPVIDAQAAAWGETAHVHGVAASDDTKDYYVQMLRAPKDGVSLVKIEPTSQTKGTQTGLYPNGDELTINLSSGMNLGGSGKYIGVKATENFQEGDVLHLDLNAKPNTTGSTQIILYAEKEATNEVWATGELASEAKDYYLTLPAAVNGHNELYIVRTEGNKWNGGPSVMEVTRAMNPMLTAMTIDGRTVTINEAAKTATVTIPYEADLAALTITKTIVWNAPATENSIVVNDGSAWTLGENTYKLTDKDGDATTYTITVARDVLKHTVSFNTHGGSAVASVEVVHNEYLTAVPNDPSKEDYIFQYWSLTDGGEEVDITAVQITENKEFHAVWASDGAIKLLNGATVNHTNFITGVTAENTVEFKGNEVHYAKFSGTVSGVNGVKDLTRVIAYNATTNKTKIQISAHNNSTSGRSILVKGLVEGASAAVDLATIDLGNKEDKVSEWIEFNNAANRTIYIMVSSSAGDVYFTQVKVIESGETEMKQAGEVGYALNLNKGRFFGLENTDLAFEGLNARLSGDYTALNSGYAKLNATSMSFTVASDMNLVVTTNNNKTYYVTKGAAGTDNETAKSGVSEFDLTAGTWYITAGSSDVQFTNIAFEAPKCAEPVIDAQPATKEDFGAGNLTASVTAHATDGANLSYQWYNADGDVAVVGETATTATLETTTEGTYYVIITASKENYQNRTIKSDEATLGYRALNDATLSALSYGGTAIALEDGVYEYAVLLDEGTTVVPALSATATMATYGATAVPTDAAAFVDYKATSTVLVTAEDGATTQTYTVKFTVQHEYTEIEDVTGNTSWNWAGVADEEVKMNDAGKAPILANYIAAPNFEKLLGLQGERAYRSNSYPAWQGTYLKFHTTVAGKVTINARYSSAGELVVNGAKIADLTGSRVDYVTFVPAGDVVITSSTGEIRIYAMEFQVLSEITPSYTRDNLNPANIGTLCWKNDGVLFGGTVYELTGKDENSKLVFDEVIGNVIKGGKPCIFVPENGNTEIKVYNTKNDDVDAGEFNGMKGTYEVLSTIADGENSPLWGNYIISNNKYIYVDYNNCRLGEYRAYIMPLENVPSADPNPSQGAPRRRLVVGGNQAPTVVTDVENLNASEQPVKLLINGQIFILRGEKMFDATGRLVK